MLLALLPTVQFAQTIVSTTPQNKTVVLEQFTGVNCGYCPDGTVRSTAIYNANPDRVVVIAVHTGNYANPQSGQPDFRTPFGSALAGQSGLSGYPAGTVNRHVFPGMGMNSGSTAMGRDKWVTAAGQILNQESYVNVGATAEIDLTSREITVYVEAYYTESSPESTNKLNVVLLQDKTYGYQANGGSNYEHNNRLVHMLTGQWGMEITETTQGSLYAKTYTYTIPEDYNGIPALLENLRVAAFVSEGNQEVISGVQIEPTYLNVEDEFEYHITDLSVPTNIWNGKIVPTFSIRSMGASLQRLDIQYKVNDEEFQNYTWEGNATYSQYLSITLPEINFLALPENTLTINITNEDDSPEDNSISATIDKAPGTTSTELVVQVKTDQYGTEVSWNITNEEDEIVANGGPYSNNTGIQTDTNISLPIGNYSLNAFDSYGDGNPGGYFRIMDGSNTVINLSGNSYSAEGSKLFRVIGPAIVTFDPMDGALNVDGDGPFTINSNKMLYTTGGYPILDETVAAALSLKKDNNSGENIPYTATVSDQKIITITPNSAIPIGTVVYMGMIAKDEDLVIFNNGVTFTMGAVVNINDIALNNVAIYPNPAREYFTVSGAENGRVTVYNAAGQLIVDQQVNSENQTINLPKGAQGVFMVKIQKENAIVTKSLVVM